MIEKQENTPENLLYMPEPERLLDAISGLVKVEEYIEFFHKSLEEDDVNKIIEKMNSCISALQNQLSDAPAITSCYKADQHRKCDEYFYIQRTDQDMEKRYILNAFIIARDLLENNKIDNYLEKEKIKLALDVMSKFLNHALSRGELI
jgi:hypothetical protein